MTDDAECVFCRIAAGKIPCTAVLETPDCLAFMDIGPLAEGHVLLIPKAHVVTLDEMSPEQSAALFRHLPSLVSAVQAATGCEGVNVLQNNGRAAHQEVMHVHVHVIPRNPGDTFHFNWPAGRYPPGRVEELVGKIRDHLAGGS